MVRRPNRAATAPQSAGPSRSAPPPRQFNQLPPHRPRVVVEPPECTPPAASALRAAARQAAALHEAPALLADYAARREASVVGRVLQAAHPLSLSNDLVLIVTADAVADPGRMLYAASAHPWHPLLDRAERGGRPRLVWLDPTLDDDQLAGIFDVARGLELRGTRDEGWGLVVPDDAALLGLARLAAIAQRCEQELEASRRRRPGWGTHRRVRVGPGTLAWADADAPVADPRSTAAGACALPLDNSPWTAAALLPAAIAGADILSLLKGAAALAHSAAAAEPSTEPLDALLAWWAVQRASTGHLPALAATHHALAVVARWWNARQCDQKPAATDAACVELVIDAGRRDPPTTSEPATAAMAPRSPSADAPPRATGRLRLARLDDAAIGQLLALLDLAERACSAAAAAEAPPTYDASHVSPLATGDLPCPSTSPGSATTAGRSRRAGTGC